ncbi:AbrB/MazE/SpoVT family DNA-binding domain-containing protein [Pseudogracilibacillus sp. SO30301A]|uniref:AbrB/MazE/SpoVT family DNA-binding domain-containing protein n=1 Tax=Pseudogracilibacillus sp. SO30301A TaxID=3098291 RepID=UPI00300DE2D5
MANKDVKKISVSGKRQMTIPKQFYDELQIGSEVTCQIVDGTLVITPVRETLDFSDFILKDLVMEGYEGDELIKEFKYRKSQINGALLKMIDDAKNYDYKSYASAEELFNVLDDEDEDE